MQSPYLPNLEVSTYRASQVTPTLSFCVNNPNHPNHPNCYIIPLHIQQATATLALTDQKVSAVKLIRSTTGASLFDSLALTEHFTENNPKAKKAAAEAALLDNPNLFPKELHIT